MFLISSPERNEERTSAAPAWWRETDGLPFHWSSHGFACWASDSFGKRTGLTLFFGRIDNLQECRELLALPPDTGPADTYDAALERWGDDTEQRLVGHYCAATILGEGRLRLVRSSWTAPPLHFAAQRNRVAVSPILNAIFASGFAREIDYAHLADQLAFDHHDLEPRGWFRGIGRVPLGSRIRLDGGHVSVDRYYDPVAVPSVALDDEACVARARELLDESARHALNQYERPAVMLSGGLDSPIVADALMRAMPSDAILPSYTRGPVAAWDGVSPPGTFGDDRPIVRAFARQHPKLQPRFPDPAAAEHDYRLRDLLDHTASPTANVANIGFYHALLEAAASDGCDGMLTGMLGNFTISLDGRWAAPEYLRAGKWRALFALLSREIEGDGRSALRRLLAEAVLPHLPSAMQARIRYLVHGSGSEAIPAYALLTRTARDDWHRRRQRAARAEGGDPTAIERNRAQAIRGMWASADSGEDLDLGLERMHRIGFRDVTAYRPLIEFCHGLPTDQFVRHGQTRYLARRLARGIMPESQRRETRMGRHNADWHARLGARREELLETTGRIAAHPQLARIVDTQRMDHLLRQGPDVTPVEASDELPRAIGLTRALTAAIFVSHAERRNDF